LEKDRFYVRIDRSDVLSREWYNPRLPTTNDTLIFWREQDPLVRGEAWEDTSLERVAPIVAANQLFTWIMTVGGPEWHDRVFMANPATFDFAWILSLWAETGLEDPFSYRTLCLRSAAFGATGYKDWHNVGRHNTPTRPHHPVDDAEAQGWDLRDAIKKGKTISYRGVPWEPGTKPS
jgi:hypothetical protein